jgi:hypothetical protein
MIVVERQVLVNICMSYLSLFKINPSDIDAFVTRDDAAEFRFCFQ